MRSSGAEMSTSPEIKASYFQANIDAIALLGPRRLEIETRMASEIAATRAASRADWLPMAWDQKLCALINDVGGHEAVIACNMASFLAATEGAFLRPIIQGALRLFGVSPRAILRQVEPTWAAGSRHAGSMLVQCDEDHATIEHVGMKAAPEWHVGMVGVLQGVLALTEHDGSAEMHFADDGHPIYDLRWQPRKKTPR